MTTRLERRLAQMGETPYGFARRVGVQRRRLNNLLGKAWKDRRPGHPGQIVFRQDFLERVSGATGIPVGQLVEDALKATRADTDAAAE